MEDLTLHQNYVSGNCYKIRLTAALVGIDIKIKEYDIFKGEARTEEFRSKISANGKVPVLQIGEDTFLPESNAACYYVASGSRLIPTDRLEHADMLRWMFWEQFQHEPAVASLRAWLKFIGESNLSHAQRVMIPEKKQACETVLGQMNDHLAKHAYFVAEKLTLADIALFGYTPLAGDAGYDISKWPHITSWIERVEKESGYVPMF